MMSAVGTRGSRGGHRDRASSAKTQTQPGGKGAQGPQPERLPKQPQATSEQMRIAQMISDTSTEDPQWQEKIQQVRDVTGRGLDEATVALHDCDGDANRAINMLLEGEQDQGEWETAGKKKSRGAPSTQRGIDSGPPGKENREEYRRGRNRDDRDREGSSSRGRGPPRMSRGGGRGGSRPRENGMAEDKEGSRDRGGRGRGDRRNRGDRDGDRRPGRFGHMNGPSRPGRGGFGRPRHDGPKIGTFNPDEIKTEKTSDIWPNTESGTWNPDQIETQEDWGADGDWTGDLSESKVFTPSAPVANPEPIRSTPYQGERIDLAKLLNPNGGSAGAAETNGPQSYGPMGDNMSKLGAAPPQGLHQQGSSSLGMTSLGTSLGTSIGSSLPSMTFAQQQNQAPDQQTRPNQLPPSLQQVIQPPSSAAPGNAQPPVQPPLSSVPAALSSVPQPLSSAQVGPRQAKPPRRKMPPPSKVGKSAIPESAVEMPGGSMYSVDSLDIQFGAMDFGSESTTSTALDFGFGTDGTSSLLGTSSLGVSTSGGSRLTATNTDTTYGSGFTGSGVNEQSLQSIMSTGATTTTQTTQPSVETPSPRSAYQSPHHTPQKDTSKGIQVTGPEPIPFPSSQMEGKAGPLVGSQRSQPSGMDALGSNKSEPSLSSLPPPPGVATSASQLSSHQAVSSGLSGSSYAAHSTTTHSSGHHSYRDTSGSHTNSIQGSAISSTKLGSGLKDSSAYDSQLSSNQPSLDHMSHSMAGSHTTGGTSTSVQSSTVQSTGSAGLTSALGLSTTGSVTSTTAPSLKGSLGTTGPHVVSSVSQPHNAAPFPGKAPPNLPPGVGLLHNQYLIGPGTAGMLPAYGFFNWPQNAARMAAQSQHQPIYSFEDMQVLQSRMPMAGYAYDMQFQPPTTLTGRDGTLPAYSGTDSKFTRGEASSPIPSSVAGQQQQQQSTHHGQTQAFLNPAAGIPPGYNYSMPFYHGVAGIAPTGFNYPPAMFMAPATKQHGAGTATTQFQQPGGYGQPGTHGYGTGYDDLTQTQDFTKSGYPSGTQTGSKGTVGSTGKGSVSSGTSAGSDLNMYGKTHQSFDKQGFPAGTPPPFNLPLATGGQGGPLNPAAATGYPHTAFMTPMMPHHTQHHSQIPHHLLQQDGQGGTSQRSQPSGSQPKGPSSKSAYGSTYWGAN